MLDPLFYPYFGGTEKVVLEVGKRLVRNHGYQVQVLTSMIPQANGKSREAVEGIDVVRCPSVYFERLPGFLPPPFTLSPGMNRQLKGSCAGADVYHIHNRFWYSPTTYRAVRSGNGAKVMLTIHNARPRGISKRIDYWGGVYDETMGRMIFRMCDRINCVSKAALVDTIPAHHHPRSTVVYNGVDTNLYRPGAPSSELRKKLNLGPGPVILSNGRLIEQKGFPVLIKALQLVKKQIKDAQLLIIGRGPLKEALQNKAAELGVDGSVHFVTGIPEEEMPSYYNMADVFALPSYYEPSAVVLYEALGCGLPIVATDAGGNPEIVSAECGRIVPKRDPTALGDQLLQILIDDGLRRSLGRASRERAVKMFDWDVIARAGDRSYRAVMEK
jgi:glycosyltransferase involved in cell wall biosynthesis